MPSLASLFNRLWYTPHHPLRWLLWPLALLFGRVVWLRRRYYRHYARPLSQPVPVIIVGNLTVGGSGKTPVVAALAQALQSEWRVGIISRGYGGQSRQWPQRVTPSSDPRLVGDEPVLLAQLTHLPVAVGPDRHASIALLQQQCGVNLIISDDGLQHYRLPRTVELVVIDGVRRFGNGLLLPAGPLREPMTRLAAIPFHLCMGGVAATGEWPLSLQLTHAVHLQSGVVRPLAAFQSQPVHAVAGIGHPERFFTALRQHGLTVIPHPFADHHPYQAADLDFKDGRAVLMTAKDGVKWHPFAAAHHWIVQTELTLPPPLLMALRQHLPPPPENPHGSESTRYFSLPPL